MYEVLPLAEIIGLMARNPGVTVSITGALVTPFAEAAICVVPGSRPIARPLPALIVATLGLLLVQLKATPLITFPPLSFAVAVICSVPLTAIDASEEGRSSAATTGETLAAVLPLVPHPEIAQTASRRTRSCRTLGRILAILPASDAVIHTQQTKFERLMYQ